MPDFLTVTETARELRQTPRALQEWRSTGKGPGWVKSGKHVLYPAEEIEAFKKRLRAAAAAARASA